MSLERQAPENPLPRAPEPETLEGRARALAEGIELPAACSGFASACDPYRRAGWAVVPLPPRAKQSPPGGHTGRNGLDADDGTYAHWKATFANGNIALRLPTDVIGIDIDDYGMKAGDTHLEQFAVDHNLPALPSTWVTSSRSAPSGIHLYRVPEGHTFASEVCRGVEIIQHTHRYALVRPSIHPEGRMYRWRDPDGHQVDTIPNPANLALLPEQWVQALTKPGKGSSTAGAHASTDESSESEVRWSREQSEAWLADQHGNGCRWDGQFSTVINELRRDAMDRVRYVAMRRATAIVAGDIHAGDMPGSAVYQLERECRSLYESPPPGKEAKDFQRSGKEEGFWNLLGGALAKHDDGGPWRERIADKIEAREVAGHFAAHGFGTDDVEPDPSDPVECVTSDSASAAGDRTVCTDTIEDSDEVMVDDRSTPVAAEAHQAPELSPSIGPGAGIGLPGGIVAGEGGITTALGGELSIIEHMAQAHSEARVPAEFDRPGPVVTEIFRYRVATDVDLQAERELTRRRARVRADEMELAEGAAKRVARYPAVFADLASAMRSAVSRSSVVLGDELVGGVLLRRGHTARLLADFKSGKTTTGLDFLRASLTGEPFLGHVFCEPVDSTSKVAHVDPELDDDWARYFLPAFGDLEDEVINRRLVRVDLKEAKAQGWTWESEADRRWLADQCAGCERVFMDSVLEFLPHGQGGDAASSMSNVQLFMDQLDAWKKVADVGELIFSIHMNRSREERSFGSVAWDAKSHALWKLVNDEGGRFFSADPGRAGTSFAESKVVLNADGRPVLDLGVSRKVASEARRAKEKEERINKLGEEILEVVAASGSDHPSQKELEEAVGGNALEFREAARRMSVEGRLAIYRGERNSRRHCLPGDVPGGKECL
jgi:hypothetical protein